MDDISFISQKKILKSKRRYVGELWAFKSAAYFFCATLLFVGIMLPNDNDGSPSRIGINAERRRKSIEDKIIASRARKLRTISLYLTYG